jgi:biopolymer transport protein ExbB
MSFIDTFVNYLGEGGAVSISLLLLFLIINYCIGYRFKLLFKGRKIDARRSYRNPVLMEGCAQERIFKELNDRIDIDGEKFQKLIELKLSEFKQEISKYSNVLGTAVLLAPLLGLLGTVIGMIETFSSLSSSELHSSSGGIAGGISQALITTQFGLLVAIPGVFISKYLKKIERKTYLDALQLQDLICEHKEEK